ncbi:vWA domain-containing protein [Corynebacterium freiburgense]|uniref:vWA domain-containing protein n=1 Tax=Corynebacterium freiburgense TaxID=556548 RepID=UPI0004129C73|nr:VWA domain-containing protein [Corynebacterium freiburgense]WJZ01664.1 von Willebrand factor type A domain protein [Corynebacterium freiburgense]
MFGRSAASIIGTIALSIFATPIASVVPMASAAPVASAAPDSLAPTVVVLDASGSMTEADIGGQTRMDAAKQATKDFLNQTPADAQLGLVTYGTGTGSSEEEKEAGCRDISVLAKPGERQPKDLTGDVDGLQPRGYTPIGNSLLKANELLPQEGARSIVLVSDGIDTCAPPPVCEVAQQLKDQGTDLVVHTIGFMVDDAARAELECVAQATGGTYADASSAESLAATLKQATKRKAVGYQLPSEQVKFSAKKEDAPMLEAGTLKNPKRVTAKIPTTNDQKTYAKVQIPEGHRLAVGLTGVPPIGTQRVAEGRFQYTPNLQSPEDLSCEASRLPAGDSEGGRPMSGSLISGVQGKDDFCDSDFYYLYFDHMWETPEDVDLTLALVPEPTDLGDDFNKKVPEPREAADLGKGEDSGQVTAYQALSQPDPDAPEVTGTVEAEIIEGETQYFATPVEWGQALDATIEVIEDPRANEAGNFEKAARRLEMHIQNQLGQLEETVWEDSNLLIEELGKKHTVGTKYPISYANAKEDAAWLAGKHFVQVSFISTHRDDGPTNANTEIAPIKYRLTMKPSGKKVQGPKFNQAASTSKTEATSSKTSEAPQAESAGTNRTLVYALAGMTILAILVVIFAIVAMLRKR